MEKELTETQAQLTRKSHHYESVNDNLRERNRDLLGEVERLQMELETERSNRDRQQDELVRV